MLPWLYTAYDRECISRLSARLLHRKGIEASGCNIRSRAALDKLSVYFLLMIDLASFHWHTGSTCGIAA